MHLKDAEPETRYSVNFSSNNILALRTAMDTEFVTFAAHMESTIQCFRFNIALKKMMNLLPVKWRNPGDKKLFSNDLIYELHSIRGVIVLPVLSPGERHFTLYQLNLGEANDNNRQRILDIWDDQVSVLTHLNCDTVLVNNLELLYTKKTEPKIDDIQTKLSKYLTALSPAAPSFEEFEKNYDQLKCLVGGQGSHFTVYSFPIDMKQWQSTGPIKTIPIIFVTSKLMREARVSAEKTRSVNDIRKATFFGLQRQAQIKKYVKPTLQQIDVK